MDWLLFLLLPPALLVLCLSPMEDRMWKSPVCISCDEFVGKTCRKNLGSCQSRHPDFACRTKEVYTPYFTGEYVYKHSILGCPKRCVEYVRITNWEKNVFFCCKENYCNNVSVKDLVPLQGTWPEVVI